ncbi:MAG: aspartate kinase, partial [Rickettsiaceae bacterium]|nr:aspartate kinase [Rickettsiaceae bacterium]
AIISNINNDVLRNCMENKIVPVIAGFQGITEDGKVTTLGRGGSDTTAVAIAASINADQCDIYTDVDGVYNADPRLIHNAKKIDILSYEEMLEFASVGAKVLHTRSVQLGMRYNIPIRVISSFTEAAGTIITSKSNIMEKPKVTGIAHNKNIASISIKNIDSAAELLKQLAKNNVNIEIVQSSNDKLLIIIPLSDLPSAKITIADVKTEIRTDLALVSVIGFGVKNDTQILGIITSILSKNNINLLMMVTSEIKISIMIEDSHTESVVKLLHEALCL